MKSKKKTKNTIDTDTILQYLVDSVERLNDKAIGIADDVDVATERQLKDNIIAIFKIKEIEKNINGVAEEDLTVNLNLNIIEDKEL